MARPYSWRPPLSHYCSVQFHTLQIGGVFFRTHRRIYRFIPFSISFRSFTLKRDTTDYSLIENPHLPGSLITDGRFSDTSNHLAGDLVTDSNLAAQSHYSTEPLPLPGAPITDSSYTKPLRLPGNLADSRFPDTSHNLVEDLITNSKLPETSHYLLNLCPQI